MDEGEGRTVAQAATAAAAIGALKDLTLQPLRPGTGGWADVADLYQVLAELQVLADRLPPLFAQLAGHLIAPGACFGVDSDTDERPPAVVATAVMGLKSAEDHSRRLARDLTTACRAARHLHTLTSLNSDNFSQDDSPESAR